jgi:hypothetical protein
VNEFPFVTADLQFPIAGMVVLAEAEFTPALDAASRGQDAPDGFGWAPQDQEAIQAGAVIAGRANHRTPRACSLV